MKWFNRWRLLRLIKIKMPLIDDPRDRTIQMIHMTHQFDLVFDNIKAVGLKELFYCKQIIPPSSLPSSCALRHFSIRSTRWHGRP